jgi:Flp pilus assembly protein TadG
MRPKFGQFTAWRSQLMTRDRATAALEFAMASPLLIIMIAGAADLGLGQYDRAVIANAVAAGAEYAYQNGATFASQNCSTCLSKIQGVVQNVSGLPNASSTVTVTLSGSSVTGPGWYCVTGTAPTVSGSNSGGTCSDGSAAGYYIPIQASYTNSGLFGGFMSNWPLTITEQATVRVQ